MLSFHGDPAIKKKYVDRVLAHQAADSIIQGTGWENGKGCAVGCTLENYDRKRYPIELGLPEWLAYLEDRIFECLPKEEALLWPAKFLEAVPIGVDVEIVMHQLAIRRMDRILKIQTEALDKNEGDVRATILRTVNAITVVKNCHEAEINKTHCDIESARSEAWATWATWTKKSAWLEEWSARSARSAAESAGWSAAVSAARSAGGSAESAGESARLAAWKQEVDDLIECLKHLRK